MGEGPASRRPGVLGGEAVSFTAVIEEAPPLAEFQAWPKTPRLFRDVMITEKIDGTNACVFIREEGFGTSAGYLHADPPSTTAVILGPSKMDNDDFPANEYWLYAQSRSRFVTPGSDNFGFARWVRSNSQTLGDDLGPGRHYGEWWGAGIQRKYGQKEKFFSLFNAGRWRDAEFTTPNLAVVPVLYEGTFDQGVLRGFLETISYMGSTLGEVKAEGVIVQFKSGERFKVTLDNEDRGKWEA